MFTGLDTNRDTLDSFAPGLFQETEGYQASRVRGHSYDGGGGGGASPAGGGGAGAPPFPFG